MTFNASKKRQKKEQPLLEGNQLIPSAANAEWYYKELNKLIDPMIKDYREGIDDLFNKPTIKRFFVADSHIGVAMDANPIDMFANWLEKIGQKWANIFRKKADELAEAVINKTDDHSKSTVKASLSVMGVKEPRLTYNRNVNNTLAAGVEYNSTLIADIPIEHHEKVYEAVMQSLSSPDPSKQGQPAIISALGDIGIKSKKRAKLIARDQTSKVYSALNEDRMRQNGVTHFRWVHSSAGKVPRESHVDKDGMIFSLDDPRLWTGPKSDQGPPGYAINCRCRAVPVLDVDED